MRKGFTLVEIIIVLALMGTVAVMSLSLFGKKAQNVDNAQKELLTALRSAQTKANNGANGQNCQVYDLAQFALPSGVTLNPASGNICFANPLLTSLSSCGTCTSTNPSLTLTLSDGSRTKQIIIEGSGIKINRIYAP